MKKYTYKVTGEYKDWLEIKKENIILHEGSLIGLISYVRGRLELRLNYGTDKYYISEIKKTGDIIITTPLEIDDLNEDYLYVPLILTSEEYGELIEISYIDRELLDNIQKATMNDIKNILLNNFRKEFGVTGSNLEFKELLDNAITFSEYDEEITNAIQQMSNDEAVILQMPNDTLERVTMHIDILSSMYEWNSIICSGNKFYFQIVDDYVVRI